MRDLRRLGWAAAVAAAVAGTGQAQQGGGGGGGNVGSLLPTGQVTGSALGGNVLGGGGGGGATNNGSTTSGNNSSSSGTGPAGEGTTDLQQFQAAPPISAPSTTQTGTVNQNINASNFLSNFYGNPYFQGRAGQGNTHAIPGGFGKSLYTVTSSAGTTGRTGMAGGLGGGRGGAVSSANTGGVLAQPRAIAYPAVVRFPVAAVVPTALQADLRGVLDRTPASMLANPGGVRVQVDGTTVILQGAVRDEDEARMLVGMVRLTPGVRGIKNELSYPKTQ